MPMDASATTVVSALCKAPEIVRELVRDLRVRWALEEIGRPYRTHLLDAFQPKPDDYRQWQPFGQVPALRDENVHLFESGAILLYLGEQDERLLPREGQARWDAITWAFAAINSVEPMVWNFIWVDMISSGKPWTEGARPDARAMLDMRLTDLEGIIGQKPWIAGSFSIADILMVHVLVPLLRRGVLAGYPNLTRYAEAGRARPAYQQALADQLADLGAATDQTQGEAS